MLGHNLRSNNYNYPLALNLSLLFSRGVPVAPPGENTEIYEYNNRYLCTVDPRCVVSKQGHVVLHTYLGIPTCPVPGATLRSTYCTLEPSSTTLDVS